MSGFEEKVETELEKRLEKFVECLEDVKKHMNEENLHDLRVSIQRLRAACYLAGRMNGSGIRIKALDRIMRTSGEIRDCHMALSILEDVGSSQGIEEDLSLKLERSTEDFCRALERMDTNKIVKRVRGIRVKETGSFEAMKILGDLFLRFIKFEDIYAGGEPYVLHMMRISLKKLRYSLEIFEGSFSFINRELLERMQELQQLLGEIHDIDTFLDRFGVHKEVLLEKRKGLTSELPPLVESVSVIEPFMKVSMLSQRFKDAPGEAMDYAAYSAFGCYAILRDEFKVKDEELLEAAILKDVLKGSATKEEIREIFGGRVEQLISAVNGREGEGEEDLSNRIKEGGRDVILLKLAEAVDMQRNADVEKLETALRTLDENF